MDKDTGDLPQVPNKVVYGKTRYPFSPSFSPFCLVGEKKIKGLIADCVSWGGGHGDGCSLAKEGMKNHTTTTIGFFFLFG